MSHELRAMSLRGGLTAKATFCQRHLHTFTYGTPFATYSLGTLFLFVKNENDDENEN